MQRYFLDEPIKGSEVMITGDDAAHITRVMRMKPGSDIMCCGPDGRCAKCRIAELTTDHVTASVIAWSTASAELPVSITIAQALPKTDKLDLIVQKGTEMGAAAFLPFQAERTIVRWDKKKREKKAMRYRKIAKQAAEQSQRNRVPEVSEPVSFEQMLNASYSFDVKMMAYEEEAKQGEHLRLGKVFEQLQPGSSLFVVIGPEGGLTEDEASRMKERHFAACSLGPRILRTETAGLYVLAAASYQYEIVR